MFDVPKAPLTEAEKQQLLKEAKESALLFANPDSADQEVIDGLSEPYASRYSEAQTFAAGFAADATLDNLEDQRTQLEKADLGAVYDYTKAILMLALLGFVGMFFAILLKRADRKQGYGLDLPSKQETATAGGARA